MNIYVSGSFAGRHRIKAEANKLAPKHKVLSLWFNDEYFVERAWDKDMAGLVAETMASVDSMQIQQADVMILDTLEPSTTGGRDAELGLALGFQLLGKPIDIIHIGPVVNIFQNLIRNKRVDTWEDFRNEYDWLVG